MYVLTFHRLVIYVIRRAGCTPFAIFAGEVRSCIMVVVVCGIQVAGDVKRIMPELLLMPIG